MKIYLIRHGEAEKREENGQEDHFLTENGIKQAKNVAEKLKSLNIDKVYSSDLTRCSQTSDEFSNISNMNLNTDEKFREIYRLIIGGPEKPGTSEDREKRDRERAEKVYSEIKESSDNLVIFTHGNMIRFLLGKVLGNEKNMWNCIILPGSISILETEGEDVKVKAINIYDHQKEFIKNLYGKGSNEEKYIE